MTSRLLARFLIVCLGAVALAGCAGRGAPPRAVPGPGSASTGLYRVTVEDPEEGRRRFRLLLYAALPDRLHGEILSPVGNVVLVFDGGNDSMAVTFVRDGVSFTGPARADAMERVLGVRLSLAELVRGLLTGEIDAGRTAIAREAGAATGLPTRLELDDGRRRLTLELKRLQALRVAEATLGRGEPPAGTEVRPLAELALYAPAEPLPDGGGS